MGMASHTFKQIDELCITMHDWCHRTCNFLVSSLPPWCWGNSHCSTGAELKGCFDLWAIQIGMGQNSLMGKTNIESVHLEVFCESSTPTKLLKTLAPRRTLRIHKGDKCHYQNPICVINVQHAEKMPQRRVVRGIHKALKMRRAGNESNSTQDV